MKTTSLVALSLALSLALLGLAAGCAKTETAAPQAAAPAAPAGTLLLASTAATPEWLAQAVAAYPMQSCPVSSDKLGSMGAAQDYVWRVTGQPDRLLRFCCKDCVPDFQKDPAKFLATLDAAGKNPGAATATGTGGHSGH